MFKYIAKLFMIYAGLLAGVYLAVRYSVYRQGGTIVPYKFMFTYCSSVVFAQFYIINILFLVTAKLLRLDLKRGPIRYFIISFMYSLLYMLVIEYFPIKVITNEVRMNLIIVYAIIPVIVFLVIAIAEILIIHLLYRKARSTAKKGPDPDMAYGLPFKPSQ
ncbi:MAG: hypothetical protein JW806_07775 [Sedimentisphaerales bacterium]|nr:hypothetical protein [Sedimentisphaerales bacterium]